MAIDALFLDVGGTLLRERRSRPAIYADAARAHGVEVADARMLALMRAAHEALPRVLNGAYRYSDPWFEAFIGRIFRDELVPALAREGIDTGPVARREGANRYRFDIRLRGEGETPFFED